MVQAYLRFRVSPAHQEMRRLLRDSGTADERHKRLARAETVDWRPKKSLATESNDVCVQGAENARQFALCQDRKYMRYQKLNSWRRGWDSNLRCLLRDSGTADERHKRLARAETVDWRPKELHVLRVVAGQAAREVPGGLPPSGASSYL